MNIYQKINDITAYLDNHLDEPINYQFIATRIGTNLYTARKIFSLLTNYSIAEYVRQRRLSKAAYDLQQGTKIIDVAIKYQYDSPTAFSRAFKAFHGVKPSQITSQTILKNFPRIILDEKTTISHTAEYTLVNKPAFTLYGFSIDTDFKRISTDAPRFFAKIAKRYSREHGQPNFGMISYAKEREECTQYSVLYERPLPRATPISLPSCTWLVFRIPTQHAPDIQAKSKEFYHDFLPSCAYQLEELPELEYYHDGVTDFLVAVKSLDKNTH